MDDPEDSEKWNRVQENGSLFGGGECWGGQTWFLIVSALSGEVWERDDGRCASSDRCTFLDWVSGT